MGIEARPRKNNMLAMTTHKPLKICSRGLFVFRFLTPPSSGISIAKVKTNPIIDLVKTT
jgi:hypothetical protein